MKAANLTEKQLDWAVATAEGRTIRRDPMAFHDGSYWIWEETPSGRGGILINKSIYEKIGSDYSPTKYWSQGGPIIEREKIHIKFNDAVWEAMCIYENEDTNETYASAELGQSPLIAAMRCYVASKLGDEVEIPKDLL